MKHPRHFDTDDATSKRMAKVKLKRGDAERAIAKKLWHEGFRYRLNYKKLPGSPDIAILKYHIAVFIDGEFWHGYDWEKRKTRLKRNRDYWVQKIEENMERDARVDKELLILGWEPIHFWAKDVHKDIDGCIQTIREFVFDYRLRRFE